MRRVARVLHWKTYLRLLSVQVAIFINAIVQLLSVLVVPAYIGYSIAPNKEESGLYKALQTLPGSGYDWEGKSVLAVTLGVVVFAGLINTLVVYYYTFTSSRLGSEIADKVYESFLQRSWLEHQESHSSKSISVVALESTRFVDKVVQPALNGISRFSVALLVLIYLIFRGQHTVLVAFAIVIASYLSIFLLIKKRLYSGGDRLTGLQQERTFIVSETLANYKELVLYGAQADMLRRFRHVGAKLADLRASLITFAQVPRYSMETIIFALVVLYAHNASNANTLDFDLPEATLIGFSILKILPAIQEIYVAVTSVVSNIASFDSLYEELKRTWNTVSEGRLKPNIKERSVDSLLVLELDRISFRYKGRGDYLFKDLSITLRSGKITGLKGRSGSGKTTLIDIMAGLIRSNGGKVLFNGLSIDLFDTKEWHKNVGIIHQTVYIRDDTLAKNIAYVDSERNIDLKLLRSIVDLLDLKQLINALDDGLNTVLGENGYSLSGGQRQKVAIARALYKKPKILILDEATTGLDEESERKVIDCVRKLMDTCIILIVSHSDSVLEQCDSVIDLDQLKSQQKL